MNIWLLIVLCGIITYLIRFIPLSGIINIKGSQIYLKIVNLIPIIVLTPIIVQAILFNNNKIILSNNFEIYSAILAIIVAFLFKNEILTIIVGMLFYLTVSGYNW